MTFDLLTASATGRSRIPVPESWSSSNWTSRLRSSSPSQAVLRNASLSRVSSFEAASKSSLVFCQRSRVMKTSHEGASYCHLILSFVRNLVTPNVQVCKPCYKEPCYKDLPWIEI